MNNACGVCAVPGDKVFNDAPVVLAGPGLMALLLRAEEVKTIGVSKKRP